MTPLQNDPQQQQREATKRKFRVSRGRNGARIRNLRAESSRSQVSLLMLVHQTAISRATPVGAPRRGHPHGPGSGQGATSVLQKHYRETPIAYAVGGNTVANAQTM
jgi:hypothetical protein